MSRPGAGPEARWPPGFINTQSEPLRAAPKVASLVAEKPLVCRCFWILGLPTSTQKKQKAFPDRSKINQKIDPNVSRIFDRLLNQLGWILGSFWCPSWNQVAPNGTKSRPQNQSKNYRCLEGLWIDFGWIWGPTWRRQGGYDTILGRFFDSWGAPERRTVPKGVKTPSKSDFGATLHGLQ